jgi:hypothetical protein
LKGVDATGSPAGGWNGASSGTKQIAGVGSAVVLVGDTVEDGVRPGDGTGVDFAGDGAGVNTIGDIDEGLLTGLEVGTDADGAGAGA